MSPQSSSESTVRVEGVESRTGVLIKRLQARHHNAANAALAELRLTIVQWDALRRIDGYPDASLHDLAQATFQSDQAFGTLAVRMETRGLIERVPGPGRAIRHRLTPEGERLLAAGALLLDEVLATSFGPLSPDQIATLEGLLQTLLDARDS